MIGKVFGSTAFDMMKIKDFTTWAPDENSHTECLSDWSCKDARQMFAVSPMLISCWTCYLHALSPTAVKALAETSSTDLIALHDAKPSLGIVGCLRVMLGGASPLKKPIKHG